MKLRSRFGIADLRREQGVGILSVKITLKGWKFKCQNHPSGLAQGASIVVCRVFNRVSDSECVVILPPCGPFELVQEMHRNPNLMKDPIIYVRVSSIGLHRPGNPKTVDPTKLEPRPEHQTHEQFKP